MKVINHAHMPKMHWKNGAGMTTEIAIFPDGSSLKDLNFTWRLSSAEVRSPGPFSRFDGYSRVLTVFAGRGVSLNGTEIAPLEPFEFRGADAVDCVPNGIVTDLGLIYRADKIRAKMTVAKAGEIKFPKGTGIIFSIAPRD